MASRRVALVTGASGFVGPYLVAQLEAQGREVVAVSTRAGAPTNTGPWPPYSQPSWRACNLVDREAVNALVARVKPQEVYHLAALSSVAASFDDPTPTYETNVMGTLHLLDAVRRHASAARMLFVSSAEVYGGLASPLREDAPFAPVSPYAASKAAAEMLVIQHGRAYGLDIVRARAFNHTGPGQAARFAVSAFARQIARIEVGRQAPVLQVGNLEVRRDFLDVRDVAAAYLALVAAGKGGEVYNVCSGRAVSLRELLDGLLAHARVGIEVEVDPGLARPADVAELRGDRQALAAISDWQPCIPLETTLLDVLTYWRAQEPFVGDALTSFA